MNHAHEADARDTHAQHSMVSPVMQLALLKTGGGAAGAIQSAHGLN
jgi:hypothetical protein